MSGYYDVNLEMAPIANELWALLVYDEEEPLRHVERMLLDQGMRTRRVRNYSEACAALEERGQPALVLTDTSFPDGTWADVLRAARVATTATPVVVVGRIVDIELYCEVMENGAYDFVVPPFTSAALAYITRGAVLKGSQWQSWHYIETKKASESA
jgi:two-component system repressor protein LuxO